MDLSSESNTDTGLPTPPIVKRRQRRKLLYEDVGTYKL